ncbi:hypothetical protein P8452_75932 [Trifolium repens]|nr:hypothetical protein P8452_75932 [Trifolium repens]
MSWTSQAAPAIFFAGICCIGDLEIFQLPLFTCSDIFIAPGIQMLLSFESGMFECSQLLAMACCSCKRCKRTIASIYYRLLEI